MLSLSFLAFLLVPFSYALSIPSAVSSAAIPTATSTQVLGPVAQLHIVNKNIAPDGFNRSSTLANGVFPAPLIQANKNDQFAIEVYNELTDDTMALQTSIHWHGIFQHKSNWADGVAYVTQCPLRQEEAFQHVFLPENQTGTYWYHSHFQTQYCDGLRGPLVIYDPADPLGYLYDVDDENTVITLADWYHIPSPILAQELGAVIANSTLINGLGRYPGGPASPLAVINVQQGLRYRFRVVSTSCDPFFNFTIDGHRMTIIEVDGNEVQPLEVDSIPILAGQRYSVVITANQTVGNYWVRASTDITGPTFVGGQNSAILRYAGAPDQDPTSAPGPYELTFSEVNLHALVNPAAPGVPGPGKADVNIVLEPGFNFSNGAFFFNNVTYNNPPVPVLLQILSGARHPSQLLPNGSVYELPLNKVIEISFPDPAAAPGAPHPIHLHGHAFSVVRSANSTEYNYANPVRRDVVSIGTSATDNVTIRFMTDNPGPWFLHCHIDWHLAHGFAVVMAEAPAVAAEQEAAVIPPDWGQLCLPNQAWGQTVFGGLGTQTSLLPAA